MGLSGQAQGYEVLHRWGAVGGVAYGFRESIVVDVQEPLRRNTLHPRADVGDELGDKQVAV
jgi:hypothetical protein